MVRAANPVTMGKSPDTQPEGEFMSSAPEETAPRFTLSALSDQDRAAIQAGRRVLHLRHRGSAFSVHRTDAGVFVTGNGHGGYDDVAGGARFESEPEASRYVHRQVATYIRRAISDGNGFYRSWSTRDGFVTVEHEILYTRWHVVIGYGSEIVHTLQLGFDDVPAGWAFVEETLAAVGINLWETDLAEPRRDDFGPYKLAGDDLFGPIDNGMRRALADAERVLFLPLRGQCFTVFRTSAGPIVTHNGLGDYDHHAQAATFRDEDRAVDFAHRQVAEWIRAAAARPDDQGFRTFTLGMGHVAVEHDQHRGRWTVVVGSETRPAVHVREFEPEDFAAGYRFVRETIENVGLILSADALMEVTCSDPEPETHPEEAADPEPVDIDGHQDPPAAAPGGLWALIRRLFRQH